MCLLSSVSFLCVSLLNDTWWFRNLDLNLESRFKRSVVTVYYILREQNADVYFSRLQYMWNLTDEWANFMLAYETDLYETPYVLKIWVVSG